MGFSGRLTLEEVNMNRAEANLHPLMSLSVGLSPIDIQKKEITARLLDYLSDPEKPPIRDRKEYLKLLNLKSRKSFFKIFSSDELNKIEVEGLALRRLRYSGRMALIDDSLLEKAAEGKAPEAKLAYQRFEGWGEKTFSQIENKLTVTLDGEIKAMLEPVYKGVVDIEHDGEVELLPEPIQDSRD